MGVSSDALEKFNHKLFKKEMILRFPTGFFCMGKQVSTVLTSHSMKSLNYVSFLCDV